MSEDFQLTLRALLGPGERRGCLPILHPTAQFTDLDDAEGTARSLNAAFLVALAGDRHPAANRARAVIQHCLELPEWASVARFYQGGIERVQQELVRERDTALGASFGEVANRLHDSAGNGEMFAVAEQLWSVFFPEGTGIRGHEQYRVASLREKRAVRVTEPNPRPIENPAREILFTSNVLLTVPSGARSLDDLSLEPELKNRLRHCSDEPQQYWYDHPIQIGVEPERNEALYGLRGLADAFDFERSRGTMSRDDVPTCLLSVSVTHRGLQNVARAYLEKVFARSGGPSGVRVFAFSEADSRRIVERVLAPAARHYLQRDDAAQALAMFGVDGPYGRHYSFLKAITAFWQVLIDPAVRATFKIDLDQVFPQRRLVAETGGSAFEHFTTPLWGARGVDADGNAVELGMIAGRLVNEQDIDRSLFAPDVAYPSGPLAFDEFVFFSALPQALSTEAEMTARYDGGVMVGTNACLHRIHVTGGTNGILIESLRRQRPFTPSFFGRAEDQAYLLSVISERRNRLSYLHAPGLTMRHDKEAFAQEAMAAAKVGKLVGDYERLLYFTAYASVLPCGVGTLKQWIDPFTGCFVSRLPTVVTYLRFALKAASFFASGQGVDGVDFVTLGARRIGEALEFTDGVDSPLERTYRQERRGWALFYTTLDAVEAALEGKDPFAEALREEARSITRHCEIRLP